MGPPQVSFFAYYMGPPLRSVSSLTTWAPPLRSVTSHTIRGPLRLVSLLTIGGPLISVSSLTKWGALSSVSSLTKWGALSSVSSLNFLKYFFFKFYALSYPCGGPYIFYFPGGGKCPFLPPPAGAHGSTSNLSCRYMNNPP